MARIRDWIDLGKQTVQSFDRREVKELYSLEWPEAKRRLIADHADAIEQEPKKFRKCALTFSALLFGLARRLSPSRRMVFAGALILAILAILHFLFASGEWTNDSASTLQLALAFVAMTLLLGFELVDKLKFRDELELARDLQANLIPKHLTAPPGYELAAYNRIANTVGGDIYDFVPLSEGRLAVLFGDASGHGMAAGLVMAVAHATFRTQLDADSSPSAVTSALNRILCRTGGTRSFFSGAYVRLSSDGSFTATLAGHPPLCLVNAEGAIARKFGKGSYPLGIKPSIEWETESGRLEPGESLLFYSDGLPEARNERGEEFGDDILASLLVEMKGRGPQSTIDRIVASLAAFNGRLPPEDDVSIAVITRRRD